MQSSPGNKKTGCFSQPESNSLSNDSFEKALAEKPSSTAFSSVDPFMISDHQPSGCS